MSTEGECLRLQLYYSLGLKPNKRNELTLAYLCCLYKISFPQMLFEPMLPSAGFLINDSFY